MMRLILGISLLSAALLACSAREQEQREVSERQRADAVHVTAIEESTIRIKVQRIGIVKDSLAYGSERGLYVIVDTKTGKEYIGVSGIGIVETGDHKSGKVSVGHEQ